MDPLEFAEIPWGSKKYNQAIQLRNRELRIPLGLELSSLDQDTEHNQLHFGTFQGETLMGCVTVVDLDNGHARIRQMVVDPAYQQCGIGTFLMQQVEGELARQGKRSISLHARKTAAGFYQKLGYRTQSEDFIEVTIPHTRMSKRIG